MAEGPLFIVDNGKSERNGLGYLREWSELASSIDVAFLKDEPLKKPWAPTRRTSTATLGRTRRTG